MRRALTHIHILPIFLFALLFWSCKTQQVTSEREPLPVFGQAESPEMIERLFIEANTQLIRGDYRQSAEMLEEILAKDPDNHASMYLYAKLSMEQRQYDRAVEFAEKAIDLDKNNYWYHHLLKRSLEYKGDFERAIVVNEQIVSLFPSRIQDRYDLVDLYIHYNYSKKALDQLDDLEQRIGMSEEIGLKKYQLYRNANDLDAALSVSQQLLDINDKNAKYHQMRYETLLALGNEAEAIKSLENVLAQDANNGFALLTLADYYKNQNDLERSDTYLFQAFSLPGVELQGKTRIVNGMLSYAADSPELIPRIKKLTEILVTKHSNSGEVFAIQGDVFVLERSLVGAYDAYRKSLDIEAANPAVWMKLLSISQLRGDYETLQKDAEEAVEFYPNNENFLFMWGSASIERGNFEEAKYALEKVKKLNTSNRELRAGAIAELGRLYHLQNDFAQSDAMFEEALEIDPQNIGLINSYAYHLGLRGDNMTKAVDLLKSVLQRSPGSAPTMSTYAFLLSQQGDHQSAKKWIEKALEIEQNALALERYGDILLKLGDREGAVKNWNQAQELGARINIEEKLQ